jgi:hypothetical protein
VTLTRAYRKGIGRVYVDEDKREYPSVTTILGSTLKPGNWLGVWQDRMRREQFHARLETEALKGLTTDSVYECFDDAQAHPNQYRDAAGDVGTLYHKAIEAYLMDRPLNTFVEQDPRVTDVIKSVAEWEKKQQLAPIKVEHYIASQKYGYAGTIDLVAHSTRENGKELVLVDWKTGSTQKDQQLQLAAYAIAYEETYGKRPNIAFFNKIDVEKATVKEALHIHFHEISELFDLFLATFKIWRWRNNQ